MSRAASSTVEWVPPMALSAWLPGLRKSAFRGYPDQSHRPAAHQRPRRAARKRQKRLELQRIDEEIETHAFSWRPGGACPLYQGSRARAEGLRQQGPKPDDPARPGLPAKHQCPFALQGRRNDWIAQRSDTVDANLDDLACLYEPLRHARGVSRRSDRNNIAGTERGVKPLMYEMIRGTERIVSPRGTVCSIRPARRLSIRCGPSTPNSSGVTRWGPRAAVA